MRGFAIILIVLNNFGHWVNGVHPDNEFCYNNSSVSGFLDSLTTPNSIFLLELLSFYSPYGVMLFIFLSGYGLTLKYEFDNRTPVTGLEFVEEHYKKLFLMQAKGLAFFLVVYSIYNDGFIFGVFPFLSQLFMVGNLYPLSEITPGPYWFFGMIMEVYVIYRFIFYRRSSLLMMSVVVISILVMGIVEPNGRFISYFRINIGLALLPFSMGVLVARHWRKAFHHLLDTNLKCLLCFFISFVLLTLCKFNFYSWLFMPIFIIGTAVALVKILCHYTSFTKIFTWIGGLSGVMFVIHPIFRSILITRANENAHFYTIMSVILIYLFLVIILSMVLEPIFVKKKNNNSLT